MNSHIQSDLRGAGLFAVIILYYIGIFAQEAIIWTPSIIIVFLVMPHRLRISKAHLRGVGWFLAMMSWVFASMLWTIDTEATINGLLNLSFMIIVTVIAYRFPIYDMDKVRSIGIVVILSVSILGLYYLMTYGSVRPRFNQEGHSYANVIAAAIVTMMPLIMFSTKTSKVTIAKIVMVMSVFILIITESRAGIVLGAVSTALSVAFLRSFGAIKWIILSIFSISLLSVGYMFIQLMLPDLAVRLESIDNTLAVLGYGDISYIPVDASDFARKIQMVYTVEQIRTIPIVGIGYKAFGYALEGAAGVYVQAHSFFGTFFVELGVIGFIMFVIFNMQLAVRLVRKGVDLRYKQEARVARMIFVGLVVTNLLFLSRPQMGEITYFIVLGFAMAVARPKPGHRPIRGQVSRSCDGGVPTAQLRPA